MNNRDYKKFAPDCYYHIVNRGNGKQDIFLDDEDSKFFIFRLRENLFPTDFRKSHPIHSRLNGRWQYIRKALPDGAFTLLCYCLMPNHFHLLIRQNALVNINKLISKVCTSYSKYFNKKYERVGHVLQDKFKAVLVASDAQLLWVSAYIHQNPQVAGLVSKLNDYAWSSYPDYAGLRSGSLCEKSILISMAGGAVQYKKFVDESYEKIKERKDIEHLLLD